MTTVDSRLGTRRGRRLGATLAALALAVCAFALTAAPAGAASPSVAIDPAPTASYGSAQLSGTVDPLGNETYYFFEYSSDETTWVNGEQTLLAADAGPTPVTGELKGLEGATKYFFRLVAYNLTGDEASYSPAPYPSATTLAVSAPTVLKAGDATAVAYTTAKVSGEIERPANPDPAFDANCHFEYVTDAQFGANGFQGATQTSCGIASLATPEEKKAVEAELTGLAPATKYHLRLTATNAGPDASLEAAGAFTTLPVPPPTVAIDPVTTHTDTAATLTGTIETNAPTPPLSADAEASFKAEWHFECEPECPNLTPNGGAGSVPASAASEVVTAQTTGLEPNKTYDVKLVATNIAATGADQTTFKTTAVGPSAETFPAFALGGGTEALLGGKVNPKNSASTYWLEYGPGAGGPSPTYPSAMPATKDAVVGSGGQPVFVTQKIGGLSAGATYHFRLVAKNATGETRGEDLSFETAAPISFPSDCSNARLRAEANSAALPECRAYEMSSEPDKSGGDASLVLASTASGSRVAYNSATGFGDSPANFGISSFMAERGPGGWATRSMEPPVGSPGKALEGAYVVSDFSADLSTAILSNRTGAAEPGVQNIFLTGDDGTTRWATEPTIPPATSADKLYAGRSADASHIVFESRQPFTNDADGQTNAIWEWVDGQVRFVADGVVGSGANAVNNIAGNFNGTLLEPTAVSTDGRRIFYSDGYALVSAYEEGAPTRAVSLSQRQGTLGQPPAQGATFAAAAEDGSRVYLSSADQLTEDATPGGGLYYYDLETDVLHFASAGATDPAGAQFQGLAALSPDGRRAYFYAGAQLVPGQGVPGADNLYMADDDGVVFLATLSDRPTGLTTPDGADLAFASSDRLTMFDNAGHSEIYLYDAAAGSLRCVSCAPDGHPAAGDASLGGEGEFKAGGRTHPIGDDGAVVFQTTDALLPEDVNGVKDVYEYRDGNVALISTGTSKYPSAAWVSSPDARNIFFTTRQGLVGQDIDGGATDVYDARVEGGFPAPPQPRPCEGEGCQGTPAPPPSFATPATASGKGKGHAHGRAKRNAHKGCKGKSRKRRERCGPRKHHAKKAFENGRGK